MSTRPIFEDRMLRGTGVSLWLGSARVEGRVRAEVLLTHGLGEHASRYEHVAERLATDGLRLHAYDLRGHGRSTGRRGDAPRYEALLDDLDLVRRHVATGEHPLFLMGHSFGGQITLSYLLERSGDCRGAVIASPLLRLAFAPERWRLLLGRLALRIWPGWTQRRPIEPEKLSRDAAFMKTLAAPELVHYRLSARLFFAILERSSRILAHAGGLETPILLLHGGEDTVTSPAATEEFFEKAGSQDKTFRSFPESRHETHNDRDRERVLHEVAQWIEQRASAEGMPGTERP